MDVHCHHGNKSIRIFYKWLVIRLGYNVKSIAKVKHNPLCDYEFWCVCKLWRAFSTCVVAKEESIMNAFGSSSTIAKPPEKGSFPLDHQGECKEAMKKFLTCMKSEHGNHSSCKRLSRSYLECRIEKGLMQKENLDQLGLDMSVREIKPRAPSHEGRKESDGFVAGLGVKETRYK